MLGRVAAYFSVVLVEGVGPPKPEITASDEPAIVPELELRLDADVAHDMKDPQQRLVRRLGAPVGQGQGLTQPTNAPSSVRHHFFQTGSRGVSEVERGVDQDDDVEQAEMTGASEQGVLDGDDGTALDLAQGGRRHSADHPELGASGSVAAGGRRGEERQARRQRREPPAPQPGRREVGEAAVLMERGRPGTTYLAEVTAAVGWDVQTVAETDPAVGPGISTPERRLRGPDELERGTRCGRRGFDAHPPRLDQGPSSVADRALDCGRRRGRGGMCVGSGPQLTNWPKERHRGAARMSASGPISLVAGPETHHGPRMTPRAVVGELPRSGRDDVERHRGGHLVV